MFGAGFEGGEGYKWIAWVLQTGYAFAVAVYPFAAKKPEEIRAADANGESYGKKRGGNWDLQVKSGFIKALTEIYLWFIVGMLKIAL